MNQLLGQILLICAFQTLVGFGLGHLVYLYIQRKKQKPKGDTDERR